MSTTRHVSLRITSTTTARELYDFVTSIVVELDLEARVSLDYAGATLCVDEIPDNE